MPPIVYFIIPCYNEEQVLPLTAPHFREVLLTACQEGLADPASRILFVNDGSSDRSWSMIRRLAEEDPIFLGLSLSRNRGHQNALFAGLSEAFPLCDVTISMDADGQDEPEAALSMLREYRNGAQVVYGIRSSRESDSAFKRITAEVFYRFLSRMGAEAVFNHADYRLLAKPVLRELMNYPERELYLRGIIPKIGFPSARVLYERKERKAGKTHYPLSKMLRLAGNGLIGFSRKPLHLAPVLGGGLLVIALSAEGAGLLTRNRRRTGAHLPLSLFLAGLQLLSLGILGEYCGMILDEVKNRPRFCVAERTWEKEAPQ